MLSKDKYVLNKVQTVVMEHLKKRENIKPSTLLKLMSEWSLDYEVKKNIEQ